MSLERLYGPYIILGAYEDMVYWSNFMVRLDLKVKGASLRGLARVRQIKT